MSDSRAPLSHEAFTYHVPYCRDARYDEHLWNYLRLIFGADLRRHEPRPAGRRRNLPNQPNTKGAHVVERRRLRHRLLRLLH